MEKEIFVAEDQPYDFGSRLQEARRKARLTQQQVALRLGINRANIGAYEQGVKTPRLKILRRMALLYQVSLDELLGIKPLNPLWGLTKEQMDLVAHIVEVIRHTYRVGD